MGLIIRDQKQYEISIRKLFPQGEYWDRQFAGPESDCSLFCKAKAAGLVRFRSRMSDLFNESVADTAEETLDDWERIIANTVRRDLGTEERRALLFSRKNSNANLAAVKEIGRIYGLEITHVLFPFRPAFFGFSRFALDQAAGPAAFSVLNVYIAPPDNSADINWDSFKDHIKTWVLANYILYFVLEGE
jgi:hypothetical protein